MPPLPPAAQVVRVAMAGVNQTHPWANIFHLKYVGASPTDIQLNSLCSSIGTIWAGTFGTRTQSSTSLTSVTAIDLTTNSSPGGIDNTVRAGTAVSGTNLPVNCALCVTWKTSARWRGGHPRTYLTGFSTTDTQSGNQWTTAFKNSMLTQATAFRTQLNGLTTAGNTWGFVVLRRHQTLTDGSHVPLNPPLPISISSEVVDSRIDSQRRRLGPDVST